MLKNSNKTRAVRQYSRRYSLYVLKHDVFNRVYFPDKVERDILLDSYIANLDDMIKFAVANKFHVGKYFSEIKDIILQNKNVRER